nr:methyltransferase domain-containing protein [Arthrobacter sp. V4I6]
MKWDPAKYVQFGDYRDRPYFDLTARIHADNPGLVVDLGCGPGNLTATLAARWPSAQVLGLDSSPEMLAQAAGRSAATPNLSFGLADITGWMPSAGTDVVVTNAALQWIPGHRELLPRWLGALRTRSLVRPAGPRKLRLAIPHADARTGGVRVVVRPAHRRAPPRRRRRSRRIPPHHARRRLRRRCVGDHLPAAPAGRKRGSGVGPRRRTPARAGRSVPGGSPRLRGRVFRAAGRSLPALGARNGLPVPPDLRRGPQARVTIPGPPGPRVALGSHPGA